MQHPQVAEFKIIVIGDAGVGKTSFIYKHIGQILKKYISRLTIEVYPITYFTNYGPIRLNIWDTAGQEKFGCLKDGHYKGSAGAIIMFDLTSRITYKNVPNWYENIRKVCGNIPICLVGNKLDSKERKVRERDITYHLKRNMKYFNISVKENYQVEKPILWVLRQITGEPKLIYVEEFCPLPLENHSSLDEKELKQLELESEMAANVPLSDEDLEFIQNKISFSFFFILQELWQSSKLIVCLILKSMDAFFSTHRNQYIFPQFKANKNKSNFRVIQIQDKVKALMHDHENSVRRNTNPILQFKIVVIGDNGIGKTTFVKKHDVKPIVPRYITRFKWKVTPLTFFTKYGPFQLNFWDTVGQEKFGMLGDAYYLRAQGAIIMFDLCQRISYKNVALWYRDIVRMCGNIPICLVGNKCECKDKKVKPNEINFHRKKGLQYYNMSLKTCYQIDKPILWLLRKLVGDPNLIFVEEICYPPKDIIASNLTEFECLEEESFNSDKTPLPDEEIEFK